VAGVRREATGVLVAIVVTVAGLTYIRWTIADRFKLSE
jgi:hypothetical protein